MNILRRLPLSRLLLLCGVVIAAGVSATALAFALDSGPKPAPKPLAEAIHDALSAAPVQGVSANISFTNHLLEGADLATGGGQGGELAQSPLVSGGSGRLWIGRNGRARIELQAEQGDTEVYSDGHTLSIYDAASNTLYRYTPPAEEGATESTTCSSKASPLTCLTFRRDHETHHDEVPTVAKIEEAISNLRRHATVSDATPSDVAGQPTYTLRVSPSEGGSLFAGAELSFDSVTGVPLRAAIYSSQSSSPAIELAASEISYGPVADSVFAFSAPPGAKIKQITFSHDDAGKPRQPSSAGKPTVTSHGHGVTAIAVIESKDQKGTGQSDEGEAPEGLPKVTINGTSATELRTELGTLLSFERSGVRYVLAGSVTPGAVEALARGL